MLLVNINSILGESAEKYEFLINNILDVIVEVDLNGFFSYVSPRVYDVLGYHPEELIGEQFFNYIHPDDMEIIITNFEKAINGNGSITLEYRIKHKEGHYVAVFAKGSLIKIDDKLKLVGVLRDVTPKKVAEQEMVESEAKFRNIVESIPLGMHLYQLEANGDLIFKGANPEADDILHVDNSQFIGKTIEEAFPPLKETDIPERYRNAAKNGIHSKWDQVTYEDEKVKGAYEVHAFQTSPGKMVAAFLDITERLETERKLKESEIKYRSLFENSPYPILLIDFKGTIIDYNSAYQQTFGWEERELIDKAFYELGSQIVPEFLPIFQEKFKKLIEGKQIEPVEAQVYKKNGELLWTYNYSSIITLGNSKLIQIISEDITERKKAENLLKQSEEKYRMIFTGASDPIAIMDKEKFIDCNELAVKVFGYDYKDEIIGKLPRELSPQKQPDGRDSAEKANAVIKKALQGEPQIFYWKHLKKDETLFDAEISLSTFKLENKDYIMAIIRDITERKKAERELREISRLKTELLERTSHELKTPLISIKGFTNLLLELHKEKFDDDMYSVLDEIKQGTERLETVINKLLETSLFESDKVKFKPSEEDLSFLIRFCVKNLQGLADTRNHSIALDIPDELILNFEKERIYEVVSHLLINAIKYTPPNGQIKIKTDVEDSFVMVSIQDNGIGFSMDDRKKIFKQFGKIERYGKGWDIGIEGTGMGLYTSKKIVKLHGGKIWAESEGRNKGSVFCFSLPISEH